MTEKRSVIPLTVPSSHMHDWKSYTNIAVFAGSLEVESEWIYIYYVMGGRSRVTLAHLKSPYSRNKQLVHLGGRLFGAQRITDQCDSKSHPNFSHFLFTPFSSRIIFTSIWGAYSCCSYSAHTSSFWNIIRASWRSMRWAPWMLSIHLQLHY